MLLYYTDISYIQRPLYDDEYVIEFVFLLLFTECAMSRHIFRTIFF